MAEIYPVILPVPPEGLAKKGPERKAFLSGIARQAVRSSAGRNGVAFTALCKDDRGCPIPENGWHWALSHKPLYVAGVAAARPVGIDVEPIRPVDEPLLRRVSDANERALSGEDRNRFFFRLWTAKEAVIKSVGGKYADIFRCRVTEIADGNHLVVRFEDSLFPIEHQFFDGHVASLVTGKETVFWQVALK